MIGCCEWLSWCCYQVFKLFWVKIDLGYYGFATITGLRYGHEDGHDVARVVVYGSYIVPS